MFGVFCDNGNNFICFLVNQIGVLSKTLCNIFKN